MDTVHRTSMRRVVGAMRRPIRPPELTLCLRALVDINGVQAYVLFDTGSTTDAVSNDFARVAKIPLYALELPATLKLGCIGSHSKINFGTITDITFASKKSRMYVDVANID